MESIIFNLIKVGGMDDNATVSVGRNHEFDWENCSKNNSGFGDIYGSNYMFSNLNAVYDDDVIDNFIFDFTVK